MCERFYELYSSYLIELTIVVNKHKIKLKIIPKKID